jgi:hypothetical protein
MACRQWRPVRRPCRQLEAHGYPVNLTEPVGWERAMNNQLIIATREGRPQRRQPERL